MKEDKEFFPSELSAEKRDLLARLLREGGIEEPDEDAIPRRAPGGEPPPLSLPQQRLWLLEQLSPGGGAYNMSFALRLSGALNVAALGGALDEIARRHDALRTTFATAGTQAVQLVADEMTLKPVLTDLCALPAAEREERARALAAEEAQQPFDLTRGPLVRARLLRLGATEHVLLLTLHHIIFDGWSLGVLLRELGVLYKCFSRGEASPLAELPIQYADFAVWQRRRMEDGALEVPLSYWKRQLADAAQVLSLPTDRLRPAAQSYRGAEQLLRISGTTTDSLKRLARQEDCSLFMLLLAAFKVLLYRYSLQKEIVVGTAVANRQRPETEQLIGFFVNTLVLRANLSGEPSFRELLGRVREVCLGAYAHQEVPFERLVEELRPERSLSRTPLFQVMFALQNTPREELSLPGLRVSSFPVKRTTVRFDLTLSMVEKNGELFGSLQYNSDLFEAETAGRMAQNFEVLLRAVIDDPGAHIDLLPLLSGEERRRLLVEWNDTRKEFPSDVCVHELFERQAARTPDAAAVRFEQERLSYRELNERANQLARHLKALGVGPESRVGLRLEKSVEILVGVLGILKAGAAYVPIDPSHPLPRIAYVLEDAAIRVLVSKRSVVEGLPRHATGLVCLDGEREAIARQSVENPAGGAAPGNAAYVIYTSGSTGKPKGVVIEHRQLLNYYHAVIERLGDVAGADSAMVQPLTFDSCQTVIFPTLCAGGCLHLVSAERASDPQGFAEYFRRHPVDLLKITPSHLAALQTSAGPESVLPRRWLVVGGEVSRREWAEELQRQAPDCKVFNHYGPTEATVGMLMYRVQGEAGEDGPTLLPTGRPLANTRAYILDPHMQPAPVGVTGELYIGGDCLARGYLNRPGLTAERFVADPFSPEPGARLYRTGDLARYLADGNVEFLGRLDQQVKVRGFRIELSEIEQRLGEHPGVREVVVMLREDVSAGQQLVAYVVPEPGAAPAVAALRRHIKEALPEYMTPSAFILLDALPRTPHGKLDRQALPAPEAGRPGLDEEFVAARTPQELAMAEIWQQVLKVERVGVRDNFFELGGHSLSAMQVVSRVRDHFQVEIQARSIFETPTVEGLTAAVARRQGQAGATQFNKIGRHSRGDEEDLLSALELLSEEEIDALLLKNSSFKGEIVNEPSDRKRG